MKILSIDGGGIRGVIPAVVLATIENRTGRRIAELFDLIVGTSTGGILACSLARPGPDGRPMHAAETLLGLYNEDGPKIFDRSFLRTTVTVDGWFEEKYSNRGLRKSLQDHLGESRLKTAVCDVFVTAYELRLRQAFFFRSARAKGRDLPPGTTPAEYDFALADVALATASAPTYFEPVEIRSVAGAPFALIDGGVFATNPAMCAYAELRRIGAGEDFLLVSLGTGTQPPDHGIDLDAARGWGKIGWAQRIIDVMFDGVSDTVEHELTQLGGVKYARFQRPLAYAREAMDDASSQNLANLRRDADALVNEKSAEIDAVCQLLV